MSNVCRAGAGPPSTTGSPGPRPGGPQTRGSPAPGTLWGPAAAWFAPDWIGASSSGAPGPHPTGFRASWAQMCELADTTEHGEAGLQELCRRDSESLELPPPKVIPEQFGARLISAECSRRRHCLLRWWWSSSVRALTPLGAVRPRSRCRQVGVW